MVYAVFSLTFCSYFSFYFISDKVMYKLYSNMADYIIHNYWSSNQQTWIIQFKFAGIHFWKMVAETNITLGPH